VAKQLEPQFNFVGARRRALTSEVEAARRIYEDDDLRFEPAENVKAINGLGGGHRWVQAWVYVADDSLGK
jgi:hypothetical protein